MKKNKMNNPSDQLTALGELIKDYGVVFQQMKVYEDGETVADHRRYEELAGELISKGDEVSQLSSSIEVRVPGAFSGTELEGVLASIRVTVSNLRKIVED